MHIEAPKRVHCSRKRWGFIVLSPLFLHLEDRVRDVVPFRGAHDHVKFNLIAQKISTRLTSCAVDKLDAASCIAGESAVAFPGERKGLVRSVHRWAGTVFVPCCSITEYLSLSASVCGHVIGKLLVKGGSCEIVLRRAATKHIPPELWQFLVWRKKGNCSWIKEIFDWQLSGGGSVWFRHNFVARVIKINHCILLYGNNKNDWCRGFWFCL